MHKVIAANNKIVIAIQTWETHKKPVLAVFMADDNAWYKVASFNNMETADWFYGVMKLLIGD